MTRFCFSFSMLLLSFLSNAQDLEIWEIQGNLALTAYANSLQSTSENIVTAVGQDRFFIQCPEDRSDDDPMTSDGMMVYTGNDTPQVEVGDLVNVSGLVIEYENLTEFTNQGLSYEVVGEADLPEPIILNNTFPSINPQIIHELERVEGMLVQFENAVTTAPTSDDGKTYLTLSGERPFREPGIAFPGQAGLPLWDGNPEVFQVDFRRILGESPDWYTGVTVSATGVMSFSDFRYVFYPTEFLQEENIVEEAVRQKNDNEISLGCINVFVLDSDHSDYQTRLTKLAKYIMESMQHPDIIAFQEVERLVVLEDLVDRLEELYPQQTDYSPYLFGGSSNGFSIRNGYLVNNNIMDVTVTQLGEFEEMSTGDNLHGRPPLLLEAKLATIPPTPISVLNIHLRSLNGITGGDQDYVRLKRHEAAISVANMIQERQDDNLFIVGDYNAFDFSDGYVDVFNQLSGLPSLGAEYEVEDIVDPPLIYQNELLPEEERYSYVFRGNAQTLDHCLSTSLTGIDVTDMAYVRGNADHPEGLVNSASAFGISDHDGFVVYMETELPIAVNELEDWGRLSYPNPFNRGDRISFDLRKKERLRCELFSLDGRLIYQKDLGVLSAGIHETRLEGSGSVEGLYILRIASDSGLNRTEKVFFG
ncbi:MAG: endonuclease/exonuclease/phosphatase family protein, partial [Saprospiraceae bacterium]